MLSCQLSQYGERCSWMRNEKFLRDLEDDNLDAEIIDEELRFLQDDEPTRWARRISKSINNKDL